MRAEIIGAKTQLIAIFPKILQFNERPPLAIPMPITAPTTAWVLDTGTSGIVGRL